MADFTKTIGQIAEPYVQLLSKGLHYDDIRKIVIADGHDEETVRKIMQIVNTQSFLQKQHGGRKSSALASMVVGGIFCLYGSYGGGIALQLGIISFNALGVFLFGLLFFLHGFSERNS